MSSSAKVSQTQLMALYFTMIATGMGQTVVFAIIPMLGRELQLDQMVINLPWLGLFAPKELAITSLTSFAALAFFIVAPKWGRRSDRVGRKPVIIIGLAGYTVGALVFNGVAYAGLSGALSALMVYSLLLISRVMQVMLMSAIPPGTSAYMIDVTSLTDRIKGIGRLAAATQIGTMLGPALAYFAVISLLAPLYIQALLTMIGAVLVWKFLPDSGLDISTRKKQKKLRYADSRYRVYLAIGFVIYTMMGMVQQTLGFYFQDTLQLSAVQSAQFFSMAMVVSSISMLFVQLVVVQRLTVHPLTLLKFGLPFVVCGYLTLANANSMLPLLLGMGMVGFGMGMATPGINVTATMTIRNDEQGSLAGLMSAAPGMGFVVGPLVGGTIYAMAPAMTYWVAGLALLPVIVFSWFLKRPTQVTD
jgi:MFS family permease